MVIVDSTEPTKRQFPAEEMVWTHILPFGDYWLTKHTSKLPLPESKTDVVKFCLEQGLSLKQVFGDEDVCIDNLLRYLAKDAIGIERKTPGDLLNSIKDGRLFTQVQGLVELVNLPLVVVEGTYYDLQGKIFIPEGKRHTQWPSSSIRMAQFSAQQAGVLWFEIAAREWVTFLVSCLSRLRSEPSIKRRPVQRALFIMTPEEQFIASIPGIGPEMSARLMEHHKQVASVIMALSDPTADLSHIKGIGKTKSKQLHERFRTFIGLKRDQALGIYDETTFVL